MYDLAVMDLITSGGQNLGLEKEGGVCGRRIGKG
jgi:hypothetical protein